MAGDLEGGAVLSRCRSAIDELEELREGRVVKVERKAGSCWAARHSEGECLRDRRRMGLS